MKSGYFNNYVEIAENRAEAGSPKRRGIRSNLAAEICVEYDSCRTMHKMDIRYSHKIEDFEEIVEVADKLAPRRHAIRFALVCVGVLLLIAPFLAGSGPLHPDRFLLGMSPYGISMIACAILQNPRRRARRYYAPEIKGTEYEATINQNGITTASPTDRAEFKWAAFSSVIEGENVLALVVTTTMYVFPRRAFSHEQWADFISLLRKHVPVWNGQTRTILLL